jgi:hypothetical protein
MIPKDAAHAANTGASGVQEFLVYASAHDIEEFCHGLTDGVHSKWFPLAKIALDVRISDQQAESADKMERFTFWLIVLTVVLIAVSLLALAPPFTEMFCHIHK